MQCQSSITELQTAQFMRYWEAEASRIIWTILLQNITDFSKLSAEYYYYYYYCYYKCQDLSDAITTVAGALYKVYQ